MFPGFHASQDLLLTLRRQAVEVLQSLFKPLLSIRGQLAELGIALKRPPLLIQRQLTVLIKPLAGMMAFSRWLIRPRRRLILPLRFWLRARLVLRTAWRARCLGARWALLLTTWTGNRALIVLVVLRNGRKTQHQPQADRAQPFAELCCCSHSIIPGYCCQLPAAPVKPFAAVRKTYGFARTSCWTCKSSSRSEGESDSGVESVNISRLLSRVCKSLTAVPG
jgi:hypothetical protein